MSYAEKLTKNLFGKRLTHHIPMDNKVLQQWLKAGYMEKQCLFPTEEGTPQGGIITPVTMLQTFAITPI